MDKKYDLQPENPEMGDTNQKPDNTVDKKYRLKRKSRISDRVISVARYNNKDEAEEGMAHLKDIYTESILWIEEEE